jgi:acetyl esterase
VAVEGRVYLERGEPVRVLVRGSGPGPRNVLVERTDGTRVVRPFRGLRSPTTATNRPANTAGFS